MWTSQRMQKIRVRWCCCLTACRSPKKSMRRDTERCATFLAVNICWSLSGQVSVEASKGGREVLYSTLQKAVDLYALSNFRSTSKHEMHVYLMFQLVLVSCIWKSKQRDAAPHLFPLCRVTVRTVIVKEDSGHPACEGERGVKRGDHRSPPLSFKLS